MKSAARYFVGLLFLSVAFQAQAVTSSCSQSGVDIAVHYVEPDVWELIAPAYQIDGYSYVTGAASGALYAPPGQYPYILQYYYNLPSGTTVISGDSFSWIYQGGGEPDYQGYWIQADNDDCSYAVTVPYCESTNPAITNQLTYGLDFGEYITDAVTGTLSSLYGGIAGGCGWGGAPSVVGAVELTSFDQCCESEQAVLESTTAAGNLSVNIPAVSCTSPPFPVWYGIFLNVEMEFAVSAQASYGGNTNVCDTAEEPILFSGDVGGGVNGAVCLNAIHQNVLSICGGGSAPFGVQFQGPSPLELTSFTGCYGPLEVELTLTYLWLETAVGVYQVPDSYICA